MDRVTVPVRMGAEGAGPRHLAKSLKSLVGSNEESFRGVMVVYQFDVQRSCIYRKGTDQRILSPSHSN